MSRCAVEAILFQQRTERIPVGKDRASNRLHTPKVQPVQYEHPRRFIHTRASGVCGHQHSGEGSSSALKNLLDRTAVSRDSQQLLLCKSATASSQAAKIRSTPRNPRVNDRHTELVQSTKSK